MTGYFEQGLCVGIPVGALIMALVWGTSFLLVTKFGEKVKAKLGGIFKDIDINDFEKLEDDEIYTLTRLLWIMQSKLEVIKRNRKIDSYDRRKHSRLKRKKFPKFTST